MVIAGARTQFDATPARAQPSINATQPPTLQSTATSVVSYSVVAEDGAASLTASGAAGHFILLGGVFDGGGTPCEPTAFPQEAPTSLFYPAQCLDDAGNGTLSTSVTWQCGEMGEVTFTLTQGAVVQTATIHCPLNANFQPGGPFAIVPDADSPIRLVANPTLLLCGGTTQITATLVNGQGNPVSPQPTFTFMLDAPAGVGTPPHLDGATGVGALVLTGSNTAELTLLAAHRNATVFAGVPEIGWNAIHIQNFCAPEGSAHGVVSVAVTATPNAIGCTEVSTLRGTARDASGNIVEGVGFHFAVVEGEGLLSFPQNASPTGNQAFFQLRPGQRIEQGAATIAVIVGDVVGTVIVHQHCPAAATVAPVSIAVTASPTAIECTGTSRIVATARDASGNIVGGIGFHFEITEGRGLLEIPPGHGQITNEVNYRLAPSQIVEHGRTVITARAGDLSGSVVVQVHCPAVAPVRIETIAVTAYPNVIDCNGQALITASARDASGNLVGGVGYHFELTSGDGLLGPPPVATATGNVAVFTMRPGLNPDGQRATITARVGDHEGSVEVRQHCMGVVKDDTMAPGLIALNVSAPEMKCGEVAFIGARVRDSKNQVPPDGTLVSFVTTAGVITPQDPQTFNGVLNVRYTAGNINGEVRITAAAGDSFGYATIKVSCAIPVAAAAAAPAPAPAAPAPAPAAPAPAPANGAPPAPAQPQPAPCIPIGDGVCIPVENGQITPPATGRGLITPPNTGQAGLR